MYYTISRPLPHYAGRGTSWAESCIIYIISLNIYIYIYSGIYIWGEWVAAAAADAATVTSLSATSESSSRRHACFCATHALLTSTTWGCAGTGLNSDGSTSSSTWCGPRSGPVPGRPNQGRARRRSRGGRLRAPGAGAGTGLPRRTMPGLLGRLL
jgi:hypothetical protein